MMTNFFDRLLKQQFLTVSLATVISLPVLSPAIALSTPAPSAKLSEGSLALSELDETLLNQSPKLQREIKQALKAAKKDDVGCFAPLLRRPFYELNNARIAPFTCLFTQNKSLTIQAKTLAKLPDGKTIPLEQLLKRQKLPQNVSLQFELTSWKWTTNNDR